MQIQTPSGFCDVVYAVKLLPDGLYSSGYARAREIKIVNKTNKLRMTWAMDGGAGGCVNVNRCNNNGVKIRAGLRAEAGLYG